MSLEVNPTTAKTSPPESSQVTINNTNKLGHIPVTGYSNNHLVPLLQLRTVHLNHAVGISSSHTHNRPGIKVMTHAPLKSSSNICIEHLNHSTIPSRTKTSLPES